MMKKILILFFCCSVATIHSVLYLPNPVVILHGIDSDASAMEPVVQFLQKKDPQAVIVNVSLGGPVNSFAPLWNQVDEFAWVLQTDERLRGKTIDIIAHSQGTVIARGFIEKCNQPSVGIFISWAGPHRGVYGVPFDQYNLLGLVDEFVYKFAYINELAAATSPAELWHDSCETKRYEQTPYLPVLNNELETKSTAFKNNILSLEQFVLFLSTQDEVIKPLASCWFGFFDINSRQVVSDVTETGFYTEDYLGFKDLYAKNGLHFLLASCSHRGFLVDEAVLQTTFQILCTRKVAPDVVVAPCSLCDTLAARQDVYRNLNELGGQSWGTQAWNWASSWFG